MLNVSFVEDGVFVVADFVTTVYFDMVFVLSKCLLSHERFSIEHNSNILKQKVKGLYLSKNLLRQRDVQKSASSTKCRASHYESTPLSFYTLWLWK